MAMQKPAAGATRIGWRWLAYCTGLVALALVAPARPATLAAAAQESALEEGWHHGAFIEIFVRAYRDSDGDGIGDLRGLTASLDYLQALGVRGIWLMPVTHSLDHDHGYAVKDFRDIEPAYGTLGDFDEFLRQSHARGIGVIVDYVINHGSADSERFRDANESADSPSRAWYIWRPAPEPGWKIMGKDPWVRTGTGAYLAQFSPTMPEFNLLNPDVMAFHEGNLRFWLDRGVDGFRFDAVTHLVENGPEAWSDQPENYRIMHRVSSLVHSYPRRYVVCEATKSAQRYAADNACGGAFAIDRAPKFAAAALGDVEAIRSSADYFRAAPPGMATMVSNHDLFAGERLWDQVGGDEQSYRLAAATYLLQPGTPFIYYGEEIGMSSAPSLQGDPKLRTPMSWTSDPLHGGFSSSRPFRVTAGNVATRNVASQLSQPDSLLAYYRALLKLRNERASIARGSYESPFVEGRVMGFTRRLGTETTRVLINYGQSKATVQLRDTQASERVQRIFPSKGKAMKARRAVTIAPRSVLLLSSVGAR